MLKAHFLITLLYFIVTYILWLFRPILSVWWKDFIAVLIGPSLPNSTLSGNGSLKWTKVGVCIPQKLATTTNLGLALLFCCLT